MYRRDKIREPSYFDLQSQVQDLTRKLREADDLNESRKLIDLGFYSGVVFAADCLKKASAPSEWVSVVESECERAMAAIAGAPHARSATAGEQEWQSWMIELEMQRWAEDAIAA
jgi:hypothetical protein